MEYINEKIQEAYEREILGIKPKEEKPDIIEKAKKINDAVKASKGEGGTLDEAEQSSFEDLDSSKQKLITSIVGKGREKNQSYFSGIHGNIVSLHSQLGQDFIRLDKKALKKLANSKDVRWVDIANIGLEYNKEKKEDLPPHMKKIIKDVKAKEKQWK